jgi:hypothetical protein
VTLWNRAGPFGPGPVFSAACERFFLREPCGLPDTASMTGSKRLARTLTGLIASVLFATACSGTSSVITQGEAEAQIETGTALNTTTATYHLSHVRVTLEKVVSLPDGMLGFRFSLGSSSPACCSFFPRVALTDAGVPGAAPTTDVVVLMSDIGPGGVLPMHMWLRGTDEKPSFGVDLAALGVPMG